MVWNSESKSLLVINTGVADRIFYGISSPVGYLMPDPVLKKN